MCLVYNNDEIDHSGIDDVLIPMFGHLIEG